MSSPTPTGLLYVFQIKYWRKGEDNEKETKSVVVSSRENQTRLDGLKPDSLYFIELRAYNAAGYGPPSQPVEIYTKKARRLPTIY